MSETAAGYPAPPDLQRVGDVALKVGLAAAAVCAVGALVDPEQLFRSYLVGYLLWLGVAVGCLALSCLHHLVNGHWGLVVLRILEAAARTIPLLALLFVPVALGVSRIYVWADPAHVAGDPLLQHKAAYLNVSFFLGRAAVYFAIWSAIALLLSRLTLRQDAGTERGIPKSLRSVSAPGIGLYGLTATFASIDWLMSLDPHWFSSMYGVYFIGSQALSALAFVVLAAAWLHGRAPMSGVLAARHFHDYGNLMLAFVMLWTYFGLGQFMIIWSGNLPEDITFYLRRFGGGWQWVGVALLLLHFALPFLLLLSRRTKRDPGLLMRLAALILVMRWVDLHWQAAPVFSETVTLHWLDLAAPVALGGVWLWAFARQLRSRPLLPLGAPHLQEAIAHG